MQGILNWKKCSKCGEQFDIDTSQDLCPECRNKKIKLIGEKDGNLLEL